MADRRELLEDRETGIHVVSDRDHQATIWTGFPGIITKFDAKRMVCDVQPAIKGLHIKKDGSGGFINMPILLDCPVLYPMGGKTLCTFPIAKDDECFIHISNRCIDAWWQNGGVQPQSEVRLHNLSDGFVFVGCWSQPNKINNVSTTTAQFRSDDGKTYVEISPDDHHINLVTNNGDIDATVNTGNVKVTVKTGDVDVKVTTGNVNVTADHVTITSEVTVNGNVSVTGDVVASGISLVNHTHPDPGEGNTGPPQ